MNGTIASAFDQQYAPIRTSTKLPVMPTVMICAACSMPPRPLPKMAREPVAGALGV
jgi:hypothetical protein